MKNKLWLELLRRSLEDNLRLINEDFIIGSNSITGDLITASEMIKLIENDDDVIYEFFEDVLSTTIRMIQLRWAKQLKENDSV